MPACVGPPPRPAEPPRPWKIVSSTSRVGRDARQLLLRAVDLPLRGEIAAVLARVRVADHHLEAPARAAIEDLLDERACRPQVGDRLEQRHALERGPGLARERLRVEHVVGGAGHRDDQAVDRLGAVPCLCGRGGRAALPRIRSSGAWIADACTRTSSLARWRPNVRARARRSARRPSATRSPRWARSSASSASRSATSSLPSAIAVGAEPLPDLDEDGAERLVGVADLGHAADHRRRHPPRRPELAELGAVQVARELAGTLERVGDRLRPDVRVAVEVAADPGAEAQRLARAREPPDEGALELGDRIPEALLEEPQPLPDLVDDPRPLGADLVGLPEQRDLLGEPVLEPLPLRERACRRRRGGSGARRSADGLRGPCGALPRSDAR